MKIFTFAKLGRVLLLAVVMAVGAVGLLGCDGGDDGNYMVVNKESNIYTSLDPKSEVIKSCKKGTKLVTIRCGGSWCEVDIGGRVGYIQSSNVSKPVPRNFGRVFIISC